MKNWLSDGITTSDQAVQSAKTAFYIALIAGIGTIIYGFAETILTKGFVDVDVVIYIIIGTLVLILGLLTRKMVFVGSLLLFLVFFLNIVISVAGGESPGVVTLIFLFFIGSGVVGCYQYPKLMAKEGKEIKTSKNARAWVCVTILGILVGANFLLQTFFVINPNLYTYPEIEQAGKIYSDYISFSVQKSQTIYKEQLEGDVSGQLSEIELVDQKRMDTIGALQSVLASLETQEGEVYTSGVLALQSIVDSLKNEEAQVIEIQRKIAEASGRSGGEKAIALLQEEMHTIMVGVYENNQEWDSYLEHIQ